MPVSLTAINHPAIPVIGYMPMPADFPYLDLLLTGRPEHEKLSDFRRKHPKMPCSKRAKLFAPFDALAGFDERIANKEILYEARREISDSEKEELDKKLSILQKVMRCGKDGSRIYPRVTVTFFSPCADMENDSYGSAGKYITYTGTLRKLDPVITNTIQVEDTVIPLHDVADISGKVVEQDADGRYLLFASGKDHREYLNVP